MANFLTDTISNGSVSGLKKDLAEELSKMLEVVVLPEMPIEQCIYRVPPALREVNPKAYTPQVISIGPFHKAQGSSSEYNYLKPMEDLKLKYLKWFINSTGEGVEKLLTKLGESEDRVRCCYSEPINYNSRDFLKMILIDVCFLIGYLLGKNFGLKERELDDILDDLILIENQLPFFILEEVYNYLNQFLHLPCSFLEITVEFFKYFNKQEKTPQQLVPQPKHFVDLIRTFMLPSSLDSSHRGEQLSRKDVKLVYQATQLLEAGLVFEVGPSNCFLDLDFNGNVLKMPCFQVEDRTEKIIRNIMAFEQYHYLSTTLISQYIEMLGYLINDEKDVDILVDKKIIVNYIGESKAVATMINNLSLNFRWSPFDSFKYQNIRDGLNSFYENPPIKYKARNKYKAILKRATFGGIVLLLLTLIQAITSILSLIFQG